MTKIITKEQLVAAGNEWLKLQFVTGQEHFGRVFTEVSTNEYLTLLLLVRKLGLHESKVYLREICEELDTPMQKVSPRAQRLQDRGLVYWEHDEQGTYIRISERGVEAMEKQQEILTDFIAKAIEKYGYEDFNRLIEMRQKLNSVMEDILEAS